jgi:excisionase family DNA binding protein
MKGQAMQREMLEVRELAALLHCSEATVRRLIDRGQIKAIRLSDTSPRRVHRAELQRYAQERQIDLNWELLAR